MRPAFAELTTPTLVVAGDHDQSLLSTRGPEWFLDPILCSAPVPPTCSPGTGGEHSLGGITVRRPSPRPPTSTRTEPRWSPR